MKHSDVTMVRVNLTAGERLLNTAFAKLHVEEKYFESSTGHVATRSRCIVAGQGG